MQLGKVVRVAYLLQKHANGHSFELASQQSSHARPLMRLGGGAAAAGLAARYQP